MLTHAWPGALGAVLFVAVAVVDTHASLLMSTPSDVVNILRRAPAGQLSAPAMQQAREELLTFYDDAEPPTIEILTAPAHEPAASTPSRTRDVTVEGDPMICGASGCIYYTGPATVVCHNAETGAVDAIEFVGVCDYMGNDCQTRHGDYVGEVWRYEVRTGRYFYRDLSNAGHIMVTCKGGWASESPLSKPSSTWLQPFKHTGRTFTVDGRQGDAFPGPSYNVIHNMLTKPEAVKEMRLPLASQRQTAQLLQASMILLNADHVHYDGKYADVSSCGWNTACNAAHRSRSGTDLADKMFATGFVQAMKNA